MTMFDDTYTVYDRRSGKLKTRRAFMALPPTCPETMSSSGSVSSSASETDEETFWKSLVGL